MGREISARQMITRARHMTKTESLDEANSFCTPDELLDQLNDELAEIEDVIAGAQDEEFSSSKYPIDLIIGQTIYGLPVDAYKLRSVDVAWTSTVTRSARRFNESQRNRLSTLFPAWTNYGRVYWRTLGNNLEIMPAPTSVVRIYLNYGAAFEPLVDLDETWDSQNGWHMAAVYGLAVYIAMADADTEKATLWSQMKAAQLDRIREQASTRITAEPPTIQRVRYRDEDDW
jgi:hypothetical protein